MPDSAIGLGAIKANHNTIAMSVIPIALCWAFFMC